MHLIKPLVSSVLLICSSLLFPQDAYARDCFHRELLHKQELRSFIVSKSAYQGLSLYCVKKRDTSVNFFLTTKGFGLRFSIWK